MYIWIIYEIREGGKEGGGGGHKNLSFTLAPVFMFMYIDCWDKWYFLFSVLAILCMKELPMFHIMDFIDIFYNKESCPVDVAKETLDWNYYIINVEINLFILFFHCRE